MSRFNGDWTLPNDNDNASPDTAVSGERRRIGRIVHDDRGAASLEWCDAPGESERPVFRIEGTGVRDPLSIRDDDTFNPYDRTPDRSALHRDKAARSGKRDLRKLSEWLKMMRELEERKARGEE